MQEFFTFLSNHSLLTGLFAITFVLVMIIEVLRASRTTFTLNSLEATQLINHQQAVVIDIRPATTYQNGHIIDAKNISAEEIQRSPKKLDKFKARPFLIVCGNGAESQKIAALLTKQGYNSYALAGGIRSWQEASMPLVKE